MVKEKTLNSLHLVHLLKTLLLRRSKVATMPKEANDCYR